MKRRGRRRAREGVKGGGGGGGLEASAIQKAKREIGKKQKLRNENKQTKSREIWSSFFSVRQG